MVRFDLSAAEQRVLNLISQAKTNKEIAATLHISPATVKRHLENILRKLRLKNRVEAAIYGLMMRACPPELDSHCPFAWWRQTVLRDSPPHFIETDNKGRWRGPPRF